MDPNNQYNQNPQPTQQPNPSYGPPPAPQPPSAYTAPTPQAYDPSYLDTIAPPPPRAKFLSGTFGKVFYLMIGLFVLAVSLIIAFSGKDSTADLQQIAVRLNNFEQISKTVHPNLRGQDLSGIDSDFQIWVSGNQNSAEDLLKLGGVSKSQYNKEMVRKEKALSDELGTKFEDARLSASLNRIYARTMSSETDKLLAMFETMSKKSKSKQIREYATTAGKNLELIHKNFTDYSDDNTN